MTGAWRGDMRCEEGAVFNFPPGSELSRPQLPAPPLGKDVMPSSGGPVAEFSWG